MSDSDDTDILLLIPPESFAVPFDPEYEIEEQEKSIVVDSLISQVNNLENRVNEIENLTSSRCESSFGDEDKGAAQKKKDIFLKEIDIYLESVKSARTEKENSLKKTKELLKMDMYKDIDSFPNKSLAIVEVDKIIGNIESTHNEIENKLRSREVEYGLNKMSPNYLTGDNISSVPDLGFGVREMFASPNTSPKKNPREPLKPPCVEEPFVKRDEYLVGSSLRGDRSSTSSTFSRSPRKAAILPDTRRYKAGHLSPKRRPQLTPEFPRIPKLDFDDKRSETSPENGRFKEGLHKGLPEDIVRNNLLSLADLWKHDGTPTAEDPSKLRQKLEEEKYRRLHLENQIQALNQKVLEEQEKLAVAMKVDEGKDKAIVKITDSWKHMVERWKDIEAERHAMSEKLIAEKASIKRSQEDINKKIDRWEKEVSQALDLAAGFKGKCEFLEAELTMAKESSEGRIKELEEQLESKESSLKNLLEERGKLMEKLRDSEEDFENEKKLVEMARNEVAIFQKNYAEIEAELSITKEQKDLLSTRLKEERGRNQHLDQQKNQLQEALTESKAKQNLAEEEAKMAREQLDKAKSELRTLYQSQLESVVRDKLAEFQGQLDAAQASMQAEIESSKKIALQKAEQQKSALISSHLAKIRQLESVHKEEMKELAAKLAESERRRAKLENGKKDIAQRLHSVMETQWQQALSIITNESSILKQNDYELQRGQGEPASRSEPKPHKAISEIADTEEASAKESLPKPGLPIGQDHLLKYIQMLLEKQPGKPIDTTSSSVWQDTSQSEILEQSFHEQIPWHQIISSGNLQNGIQEPQGSKKPPWK